MKKRFYIMHCCAKKDDDLKLTSKKSTPDMVRSASCARVRIRELSGRYIPFDDDNTRIGSKGVEVEVGTVASCTICKPSTSWLGRYCTTKAIQSGKL